LECCRNELLDDAVFQRMKADHHQQTAMGAAHPGWPSSACCSSSSSALMKIRKSLKCARRRVLARLAGLDRASHELGQFGGG
jgi:hypothetical protein